MKNLILIALTSLALLPGCSKPAVPTSPAPAAEGLKLTAAPVNETLWTVKLVDQWTGKTPPEGENTVSDWLVSAANLDWLEIPAVAPDPTGGWLVKLQAAPPTDCYVCLRRDGVDFAAPLVSGSFVRSSAPEDLFVNRILTAAGPLELARPTGLRALVPVSLHFEGSGLPEKARLVVLTQPDPARGPAWAGGFTTAVQQEKGVEFSGSFPAAGLYRLWVLPENPVGRHDKGFFVKVEAQP